jgi:hypothetical protein
MKKLEGQIMATYKSMKAKQSNDKREISAVTHFQRINEAIATTIEQYKAENPDVDVEAILSEHTDMLHVLGSLQSREVNKFVAYAKNQGTKMSFDAMEMGMLAAGRKDMQNGLAEILDSLEFGEQVCSECGEKKDNRGRSKKKS